MDFNKIEISKAQFTRAANDFAKYAKEDVKVKFMSSAFWVFGSELATLRIARTYRSTPQDRIGTGYSDDNNCHYFRLNIPNFVGEVGLVSVTHG